MPFPDAPIESASQAHEIDDTPEGVREATAAMAALAEQAQPVAVEVVRREGAGHYSLSLRQIL